MAVDHLTVLLGERSYPIHFGADLAGAIKAEVARLQDAKSKVAVITDTTVQAAQSGSLRQIFEDTPVMAVAPGEGSKTLRTLESVHDFLAVQKLDRAGVIFAVGGGVIGDLAG